ncbi:MAG TPA: BrnT family toxin [Candidatus Competibacteraceae bacterium]|nr:BrnT family toxin [Candidatus Competibacteraceae bacterium]
MVVEFDPRKAMANRKKHGVSFAEAEPVLNDPLALTRENGDAEGETRFVTVGLGAEDRVLVVVWTQRGSNIRLISARKATRNERRMYEG